VLPAPGRTSSGYRQYTAEGVQQLLFVRRARVLGLPLHHLKTLIAALNGGGRPPMRQRVREVIRAHLSTIQGQIRELRLLERQLGQVLRGAGTSSRKGPGERCRCLEPPDMSVRRRRRDGRYR
jgi:DNA-binding transcriptional MerR regulator